MGSVSVSSCRCCMFVSCVHPVAVLNAAFCIIHGIITVACSSNIDLHNGNIEWSWLYSHNRVFDVIMNHKT